MTGLSVGICDSLNGGLLLGMSWMLWSAVSVLVIFSGWPAMMPKTCGL